MTKQTNGEEKTTGRKKVRLKQESRVSDYILWNENERFSSEFWDIYFFIAKHKRALASHIGTSFVRLSGCWPLLLPLHRCGQQGIKNGIFGQLLRHFGRRRPQNVTELVNEEWVLCRNLRDRNPSQLMEINERNCLIHRSVLSSEHIDRQNH